LGVQSYFELVNIHRAQPCGLFRERFGRALLARHEHPRGHAGHEPSGSKSLCFHT
jgi:hypothetical protein